MLAGVDQVTRLSALMRARLLIGVMVGPRLHRQRVGVVGRNAREIAADYAWFDRGHRGGQRALDPHLEADRHSAGTRRAANRDRDAGVARLVAEVTAPWLVCTPPANVTLGLASPATSVSEDLRARRAAHR